MITIVPFTKNTTRVLPFQTLVPVEAGNGLEVDSKAQAEQVRAVDYARFVRHVGSLSVEHMASIDANLALHLGLW